MGLLLLGLMFFCGGAYRLYTGTYDSFAVAVMGEETCKTMTWFSTILGAIIILLFVFGPWLFSDSEPVKKVELDGPNALVPSPNRCVNQYVKDEEKRRDEWEAKANEAFGKLRAAIDVKRTATAIQAQIANQREKDKTHFVIRLDERNVLDPDAYRAIKKEYGEGTISSLQWRKKDIYELALLLALDGSRYKPTTLPPLCEYNEEHDFAICWS